MRAIYRDFCPWLLLLLRRRRRFLLGTLLVFVTLMAGLALLGLSGWFITASALAGIALSMGLPVRCLRPRWRHSFFCLGAHYSALHGAAV